MSAVHGYCLRPRHDRPFSFERMRMSDAGLLAPYVRLGCSRLPCGGRGLFATRTLPARAALTAYPGPSVPREGMRTRSQQARLREHWWYVFEVGASPHYLNPDPNNLSSGVAHLANDAIHPEITGRQNNCEFCETADGTVFLQTTRPVRRGEELLADYSLPYWIDRSRYNPPLPSRVRSMLANARKLQSVLHAFSVQLDEYVGEGCFKVKDCDLRLYCRCGGPTAHRLVSWHKQNVNCTNCMSALSIL